MAILENFSRVDNTVFRSGLPGDRKAIDFLCSKGISTIISLHSLNEDVAKYAQQKGITLLRSVVELDNSVKKQILEKFFGDIVTSKSQGKKVLVHCLNGTGRTGVMVGLYQTAVGSANYDHLGYKPKDLRKIYADSVSRLKKITPAANLSRLRKALQKRTAPKKPMRRRGGRR